MKEFDKMTNYLTKFSKYHLYLAVIFEIAILTTNFNIVNLPLQSKYPKALCLEHPIDTSANVSHKLAVDFILAQENSKLCNGEADYCAHKKTNSLEILHDISIKSWTYKFDLTCERNYLMKFMISSIFIFSLISNVIFTPISDKWGRLTVLQLQTIFSIAGYTLMSLESSVYFVMGGVMLIQSANSLFTVSMICFNEFFDQQTYTFLMNLYMFLFGLSGVVLNTYTTFFTEIRYLIFVYTGFSFTVCFFVYSYLTETPKFIKNQFTVCERESRDKILELKAENQDIENVQEAVEGVKVESDGKLELQIKELEDKVEVKRKEVREKLQKSIAYVDEFNGVKPEDKENDESLNTPLVDKENATKDGESKKSKEDNKSQGSNLNQSIVIESYREIVINFLVVNFLWIANQVFFYGTVLNLDKFDDVISYGSILTFTAYITTNLVNMYISLSIGRKTLISMGAISSAACIFVIMYFDNKLMRSIFFFFFLFFAYFAGNNTYVYAPELFPVSTRSTAVAYSKLSAKLVNSIFPFLVSDAYSILRINIIALLLIPLLLTFTRETLKKEKKLERL